MQSVLIVDDLADNIYFLEALLKGYGLEARSASNGAEALESARRNPPDLVVSDILMPVMDGYTLCREWRADPLLRQIPFMFYTATFTSRKDEELAISLGADCFVIKPQEPDALMAIIRRVLSSPRAEFPVPGAECGVHENSVLKQYSESLFRKLEKKMADLEQANRELVQRIEEQRRLEEQLRQAQKMEAIGRFSAGIAHDFNNILTVIMGFGTMLRMKMPEQDPQRDKLDHILAAADRAKNLTSSLLTFSRKQEMKLQPLDLNTIIARGEAFLRRVIGEDITLITTLNQGNIPVLADGGNIEQVLMNLAVNARDAMPDGGILTIGTGITDIDDRYVRMHGYGSPGQYAVLTLADSGTGMDENTRQQVFDPFFTTKQAGHGTGLGLSIVYGIVKQHGGFINIYSEPGQGTTFRILLPLRTDIGNLRCIDAEPYSMCGGDETILVVDDEASIREYLETYLAGLGYRVLLAGNGQQAVELFRARSSEIGLVLMDVIMPKGNSRSAAREMREIRSNIRILFTSGYPRELIYERNLLDQGEELMLKPLTPSELAIRVRTCLDS